MKRPDIKDFITKSGYVVAMEKYIDHLESQHKEIIEYLNTVVNSPYDGDYITKRGKELLKKIQ